MALPDRLANDQSGGSTGSGNAGIAQVTAAGGGRALASLRGDLGGAVDQVASG